MTTFVDTSAFYALLTQEDAQHDRASAWLDTIASEGSESLLTHNYVVLETISLVHRRLGGPMSRLFIESLLPVCETTFVDQDLHTRATIAFLAGLGRRPSFVDRVSFELMRARNIRRAFAFDPDFTREGFETVPLP